MRLFQNVKITPVIVTLAALFLFTTPALSDDFAAGNAESGALSAPFDSACVATVDIAAKSMRLEVMDLDVFSGLAEDTGPPKCDHLKTMWCDDGSGGTAEVNSGGGCGKCAATSTCHQCCKYFHSNAQNQQRCCSGQCGSTC